MIAIIYQNSGNGNPIPLITKECSVPCIGITFKYLSGPTYLVPHSTIRPPPALLPHAAARRQRPLSGLRAPADLVVPRAAQAVAPGRGGGRAGALRAQRGQGRGRTEPWTHTESVRSSMSFVRIDPNLDR